MLAQLDLGQFIAPRHRLGTLRKSVAKQLDSCPCEATRQRILLAVNEIIANILRHAAPAAHEIAVDFLEQDDEIYVIICDDGGAFRNFSTYWAAAHVENGRGLSLVKRLCSRGFYVPRSNAEPYNRFILPIGWQDRQELPAYFQPQQTWVAWRNNLAREEAMR